MVLGVALLAAVLALFLVRGMAGKPAAPATQQIVTNGVPVLVATRPLDQGDTAAPGDLGWANFPTESLSENFLQQKSTPSAMQDFTGAVARFRVEKGEPITAAKLIKPGEQGFMAALLTPGYRAVSMPITQNSGVAGFVQPNDHVDIISTRKVQIQGEGGNHEEARSNVILEDVRVLAIDQRYRPMVPGKDPPATPGSVATLELTPADAEILAMSDKVGEITMTLRGVGKETHTLGRRAGQDAGTGSVRIHKFGSVAEASVKSSGGE